MRNERANQSDSEQAQSEAAAIVGNTTPRGQLAGLPRRIYLTYSHHGARAVALRTLTFPLRFTPLRHRVMHDREARARRSAARAWYRRNGKPITVVIPSYRDAEHVSKLVRSIRRTTTRRRVRIIVSDDAGGPEHAAALARIRGIDVVTGERNEGFAVTVNRGIRASDPSHDVVVLNSDTVARRGWLAALQRGASREARAGIVGGKLLYPDGRIQFAGTIRNPSAPEWFDHRFRFKPAAWGAANVVQPVLAVTGACMYIKRAVIEEIGLLDEAYPMAYEDVDYCLRAWRAGWRVLLCPDAELTHFESTTRGTEVQERERTSQQVFWARWGDFFDSRNVRGPAGSLRVIYVTQDCGVGGGHRVIFEQLNRLQERGHHVELWTLEGPPDWFELRVPLRVFGDYDELRDSLAEVDAIKIATWWETAEPVWEASVSHGVPVYFVQDIETSYYRNSEAVRHRVLASYDSAYRYLTTSAWNAGRLADFGLAATIVSPGIELGTFRRLPRVDRRRDMVLALGRSNPLKNLRLTLQAWRALPEPRPELCLFGIEPELAPDEPGVRYVTGPSDAEVNRLLNQATLFLQTSDHEGFCLPVLEAMATGCPVVCTDAHGNRDYCEHESNCLMPESDAAAVATAISRLLRDDRLREQLGRGGVMTAQRYGWSERIDGLERFLLGLATPRRIRPSTDAVPDLKRTPVK